MCLRYPNARLSMLERLTRGGDNCYAALHACSRDFGLIERTSQAASECHETCAALQAAKFVTEAVLEKAGIKPDSEAMQQKSRHILGKIQSCLAAASNEFEDKPHNEAGTNARCAQLAPLVIDCMLQHLQPYL